MKPTFETLEDVSVVSEISDATIAVRLRRQLNYEPSRFTSGPYWLDLRVGSVHKPYYCVGQQFAREAAARFLLEYVKGIVPSVH
jgi:hypothetical protein